MTENRYTLRQLVLYFLRLGTIGFGGPVALVEYMRRDLVEDHKWISEADYKEGLALAQLAPGPLAAQLGIYLGYVDHGILGATLTGLAFVLPSFLMVVALGFAYKLYGGLSWMQAVFYGVGASVIGIIAHSAYKLTHKTIGKEKLLWLIYLAAALATIATETENVLLFLGAGILAWWIKAPPQFLSSAKKMNGFVPPFLFVGFFAKAGAMVFGSGLAIIPFLYGGVVNEYHWLNVKQFLDAVAVAMITPGPVVITVGFIGFLVAGFRGACLAALATFLPCYLFTIIPAPYFKKYGKRPGLAAFVAGVTAAATGAITGAVVILGRKSISDIPTALLAAATVTLLFKSKKIKEPVIVLAAAILGLVLYPSVSHPSLAVRKPPPLELTQRIPLENIEGRIDHLDVDETGKRLFVAALGNNTVEVFNSETGQRLQTLAGFEEPQGVLFIPEFNELFVTNGGNGQCDIFDGTSFKRLGRVSFPSDADNIRYDTAAKIAYVGYGNGALGLIDAQTGKRLGEIALSGHPESFQMERSGHRIFVNVPGGRIAVVDKEKRTVIMTLNAGPFKKGNYPMALDEAHHRLFVGYRWPSKIIIFDTESGEPVAQSEGIGDVDDIFYDAARKRVYASGGDGTLLILQQTDPDHYPTLSKIETAPGARTSLFVPQWNRLYLAVPHRGVQAAELWVYRVNP